MKNSQRLGYFTTEQIKSWMDYKESLLAVIPEDDPRAELIREELSGLSQVIEERVNNVIRLL